MHPTAQNDIHHTNFKDILKLVALAIIVFFISFPEISPVVETGLDGSAYFAFNYYFSNGLHHGVDVVFTYGPLGFLKAPLPMANNLIYAIIFLSVIRFVFIFLFLYIGRIIDPQKWLLHFFVALIIASITSFDLALIGIIIASLVICFEKRKIGIWVIIAIVTTVFALLIKASIGVTAMLILVSYIFIDYYKNRRLKTALIIIGGSVIIFVLFWLILYGNSNGILTYFYGTYNFVEGNSSAMALHPYNNWIIIISFIIIFLILPFTIKDKRVFLLYGLVLLSVFAYWKYSFSREENFHLKSLLDYLILLFAIIIVFSKKIRTLHLILMAVCLMLYYRNMALTDEYNIDDRVSFIGVNNFIEASSGYSDWVKSSNNHSERNIITKKIERSVLEQIDGRSIDVYPWDYTFIAANDLQWAPRPVLQSYASNTLWLDLLNAKHFKSSKAPDLIIWELNDRKGRDEFGDVDMRYMLNDEPNTIYQLLNSYEIISKNRQMILFEKTDEHRLKDAVVIETEECEWNEWIGVPKVDDGILRAKLFCEANVLRSLRNLIYKDAVFYVEYKLEDGKVLKYRIVLASSESGVWVNPLIIKASDDFIEALVTEVRFTNSRNSIMKDKILIDWELIGINDEYLPTPDSNIFNQSFVYANALFGKNLLPGQSVSAFNDFEDIYPQWSANKDKLSKVLSSSGEYSIKLDTINRFSPSWSILIEELKFPPSSTISVRAGVNAYLTNGAIGNIVISVERGDNIEYWNGIGLEDFSVPNLWNRVTIDKNLPQGLKPTDVIKIYVWNNGLNELYLDDFEIKIENAE